MIAIYLAPVYIILNLYILRWAYLWIGSCHSILRTMAFRTIFAIIYAIVSTSLVSGFFIKKPRVLRLPRHSPLRYSPGAVQHLSGGESNCGWKL